MSWIEKLYQTYEECSGNKDLEPICHTSQQAHIEVVLDQTGNFRDARVIPKGKECVTLVPCTEASATRSSTIPHPLSDYLKYLAGDFALYAEDISEKDSDILHKSYVQLLSEWADSTFAHPKVCAIHQYIKKRTLLADLIQSKILFIDDAGKLLKKWQGDKREIPPVFRSIQPGKAPQDAFVRWIVESPGDLTPETWKDKSLFDSWIKFDTHHSHEDQGLCMATGEESALADKHPAKIRHSGDKTKLISTDDKSGYKFRGRFINANQALGVSFEVTQKAHNALRWLIARQGYRNGDQVFVAWAVSGKDIPDPLDNSFDFVGAEYNLLVERVYASNAGQEYAFIIRKAIQGYKTNIPDSNNIVMMGLDSTSGSQGRLSITYYRELTGFEFLDRIQAWHLTYPWHQHYSKDKIFVGAPSATEIPEAAYGHKVDEKLKKATVARLIPCITDGQKIPLDLLRLIEHRATQRQGLEFREWEKTLGIACGLFRGYHKEKEYQMSLETERTSRDYLFGRLLALAENLEERALFIAGEKRDTNAAKLMQRFADQPCNTWKILELQLSPYKTRLRANSPGFLRAMEKEIDEVMSLFKDGDFIREDKLSGEFLLGYHCQRRQLREKPIENSETATTETTVTN